jgi:hypothetical protein
MPSQFFYNLTGNGVAPLGNAATVGHSSKKQQSGKDSVIKGQPLLLFMLYVGD